MKNVLLVLAAVFVAFAVIVMTAFVIGDDTERPRTSHEPYHPNVPQEPVLPTFKVQ